ncbi:hypothetical protein QBC35DRAFT_473278 [Podospora australis]|uniref:Uncharacterized protein n=1 Tax=Podospora australis TaxID=1536484 RepID=A0AAN6WWR5_9PEZI|nr:hypothetical protein QBC35DRAFT_473278 [Podospora australis]
MPSRFRSKISRLFRGLNSTSTSPNEEDEPSNLKDRWPIKTLMSITTPQLNELLDETFPIPSFTTHPLSGRLISPRPTSQPRPLLKVPTHSGIPDCWLRLGLTQDIIFSRPLTLPDDHGSEEDRLDLDTLQVYLVLGARNGVSFLPRKVSAHILDRHPRQLARRLKEYAKDNSMQELIEASVYLSPDAKPCAYDPGQHPYCSWILELIAFLRYDHYWETKQKFSKELAEVKLLQEMRYDLLEQQRMLPTDPNMTPADFMRVQSCFHALRIVTDRINWVKRRIVRETGYWVGMDEAALFEEHFYHFTSKHYTDELEATCDALPCWEGSLFVVSDLN